MLQLPCGDTLLNWDKLGGTVMRRALAEAPAIVLYWNAAVLRYSCTASRLPIRSEGDAQQQAVRWGIERRSVSSFFI